MSNATLKVWLDLDQKALDDAYDQTVYAPNLKQIAERLARNSQLMRERRGEPSVFNYGPLAIQKLYYYAASSPHHPILIFVRGGAWRQKSAQDMAFPAQCFNDAGIGFAVFDFNGVDETGGDLWPLLNQVISALAWLPRNAAELGGDPDRLFVAGFSSGAHLAAVAMTTDWQAQGFAANPYQGAVLISGMYDLRAVRLSKRSEYVTFTDEVEHSMSVQRHLERYQLPTVLAYGMYETPEFQRQTCEFSAALRAAGKPVQLLAEKGCNHVEMMESLGNPYSLVGQATLNLIASQSRQRKSS